MPNQKKTAVEWFPHPVAHGRKMALLERKYGNNGYAVWFKILEEIGSSDTLTVALRDEIQIELYASRCLVEPVLFMQIIGELIRWEEFNTELWQTRRVLYSEKFIASVSDVYRKRRTPPPSVKDIQAAFSPCSFPLQREQPQAPSAQCQEPKAQIPESSAKLPEIATYEDIQRHHPILAAMAMSGETEETNPRAVNTWRKYLRILSAENPDRGIRMFRDVLERVLGEHQQGEAPNIGKAITGKLKELCK